jgi:hypothetical protein
MLLSILVSLDTVKDLVVHSQEYGNMCFEDEDCADSKWDRLPSLRRMARGQSLCYIYYGGISHF